MSNDTLTLNDYLPVLNHPDHGGAICEAAGVRVLPDRIEFYDDGDRDILSMYVRGYKHGDTLDRWATAALSHGLLAWVAERAGNIDMRIAIPALEAMNDGVDDDFDPAAILAAAKRCMGVE